MRLFVSSRMASFFGEGSVAAWEVRSQKKSKRKKKIRGKTKIGSDSLPLREPFVSARGGHEAPGPFLPNQVRVESES